MSTAPGRAIIHLNVADFAVAVERGLDTRLRRRPVIIAAQAAARAIVYDMSEEAFSTGVRKGMPLWRAQKFCRDARILPPKPDRYERAMRHLFSKALPYAPRVELVDDKGHLFLDVTGTGRLLGRPEDIAWKMRNEVRKDFGFDPVWAVAPNKLLAKVATRIVKPLGEYIVEEGEEEEFLKPIPVTLIPGIEKPDIMLMFEFNLKKAGDLLRWNAAQLEAVFQNRARHIYDAVRGIDPSPVLSVDEAAPVVNVDHPFGEDTNDAAILEAALYVCVEKAGVELRQRRLAAGRVGVVLDHTDGVRVSRATFGETATAIDPALFRVAMKALALAWRRRVRIRHLKLVCDRLCHPPSQVYLFVEDERHNYRENNLIYAIDRIRMKFGDQAVSFGRTFAPISCSGGTDTLVRGAFIKDAHNSCLSLRPSGATRTGVSAPPNKCGDGDTS